MELVDILKDILQDRASNQLFYNHVMVDIRNPEVRRTFLQIRDDEMRDVVKLQEWITRLKKKPNITARLFPSTNKY